MSLLRLLTLCALSLAAFLLVACGHITGSEDTDEQPQLHIVVFAPDAAVRSRANTGYVGALEEEKAVKQLQIWVFEHENGALVGYLKPNETATLNANGQDSYSMAVTADFAQRQPNVDVYVMANVAEENCLHTYDATTTRTQLDAALLAREEGLGDAFGLTTLCTTVSSDEGLPMSGVLKEQPVYGDSPVLRVGTSEKLANVRLVRAVSKLRILFAQAADAERNLNITSVSLDAAVMPRAEYLFLDRPYTGSEYRIASSAYEGARTLLTGVGGVFKCTDPTAYVYTTGTDPQAYEDLLQTGLTYQYLTQAGLFYLRESDRALTGRIRYRIDGSSGEKEVAFSMATAGDFSRNHTWTIYAYFLDNEFLQLSTLYVTDWDDEVLNHEVYNW